MYQAGSHVWHNLLCKQNILILPEILLATSFCILQDMRHKGQLCSIFNICKAYTLSHHL